MSLPLWRRYAFRVPIEETKKTMNSSTRPTILCLAHLGWDNVWQRPQHILSRLAHHYPVIYVNEPFLSPANEEPHLKLVASGGNVSAWQPFFPQRKDVLESWPEQYVALVKQLLLDQQLVHQNGVLAAAQPLILWFYTPTPHYFLDHFPADLVVYDVMDELANFKNAAADLRDREKTLLERADLVFTGGRSMYQARQGKHPNLHLFSSGVEPEHFAAALQATTPVAPEIRHLTFPVLGYYGVIDERIDLALLDRLATTHPDYSIVMVGPVAKIDPADLPRHPNIIYTGQQPYEKLPHFLKGFDVCLMPFAMNEATCSISPTKTLEYMAAHKPIVSTPVPDVVTNWGDVVLIAEAGDEFAAAIQYALHETTMQRAWRIALSKKHLACSTWDHITQDMRALIETALMQQVTTRPHAPSSLQPEDHRSLLLPHLQPFPGSATSGAMTPS